MIRTIAGPALAGLLVLLAPLAGDVRAEGTSPAKEFHDVAPGASAGDVGSWVRVSLDPDDPLVASADRPSGDVIAFHVFAEGRQAARGIDYGLVVEGGDYVAYTVATDRAWMTLPLPDGFPQSIGQAIVGPDCVEGPLRIGTLLVRPHEPGGKVVVTPTRSAWSKMALLLDCDNLPMYSFVAYSGAANGRPGPPRVVHGDEEAQSDAEKRLRAKRNEVPPPQVRAGDD